jgi:hypothetical protein
MMEGAMVVKSSGVVDRKGIMMSTRAERKEVVRTVQSLVAMVIG